MICLDLQFRFYFYLVFYESNRKMYRDKNALCFILMGQKFNFRKVLKTVTGSFIHGALIVRNVNIKFKKFI